MSHLETRLAWQRIVHSGRPAQFKVAILATFTVDPLVPYLGMALEAAGLAAEIWVGPYHQMVQECLADASETARFKPDVLIAWPRLEELWGGKPLPLIDHPEQYVEEALQTAEASLEAVRRWRASLIFVLPGIPEMKPLGVGDACSVTGVAATATWVREAVRRRLAQQRGVLLYDFDQVLRALGSSQAYDLRLQAIAHIPFSEESFSRTGKQLARLIELSRRPARKVVAVDGDNTLWGGQVGEMGADGVDLNERGAGEAYLRFQSFLIELRRAGALLALCSKNEAEDVWQVFARREMRLKKEHLSAWRIGWQAKSDSLREMAAELGLGIDSFVFIDDNPAEVAQVQAALPEVACLQMPANPANWSNELLAPGVLDRLPPTSEDLQRATQYEQERLRNQMLERAVSPEEYLTQLGIRACIFTPTETHLPRLAQLVAKTNQFNLNGKRRTEHELAELASREDYVIRMVQVQDRFGDYGIVGVFIVHLDTSVAQLDTFLLSCRALGRGVEEAMIADIFGLVSQRGLTRVQATLEECPRNEPARRFFSRLGCAAQAPTDLSPLPWPAYVERL